MNQTRKPDKLVIFDDNDEHIDLRQDPMYAKYFFMLERKGIAWEWLWAGKKGQHHNHQLANQLGIVRNLGIAKIAKRETFLIDPQGTVVYHYSSVNTQTHAGQVLADIQKFSKK